MVFVNRHAKGTLYRRPKGALTHFWWSRSGIHRWSTEGINAVQSTFQASTLVPRGFVVDDATSDEAGALIMVRAMAVVNACPGCGTQSGRVHSRYRRHLADLPIAGRPVRVVVLARRFYCNAVLCGRRVFTERFGQLRYSPIASPQRQRPGCRDSRRSP